MATMLNMYYALPPQFKTTPQMTGDTTQDIYAFQAANIQATLQLLRMMLFSTEDNPSVERKCDVASEVLSVFQSIPENYLKAISTPMIYQLGSIGGVLGSVFEQPLPQILYERVRSSLVLMANLLQTLESNLHRSAGASQGLLAQVEKIDQYMQSQRGHPRPMPQQQTHQSAAAPPNMSMGLQPTMPEINGNGNGNAIQIPTDLALEWPWPVYPEYPYYMDNGF